MFNVLVKTGGSGRVIRPSMDLKFDGLNPGTGLTVNTIGGARR